jgi:hypothetical protein
VNQLIQVRSIGKVTLRERERERERERVSIEASTIAMTQ